ncbi:metalloproteinase inhibitor 4 isoform X1 [Acinonyx jubatus]|uniref:Metalloproteinase inhibitor 4 n=1 Tax=Acinonyx jubatus TaxID=32536 RepID=A0ABM3PTB6_ACIJB|nr:metalloproteinase inhibitor 4 isoform X1 [Acinonyx jubatus]
MPRSPRTGPSWALLLRLLALLRPPGMSEACSCAPAHPQQHVCHSALAIRAKISSEKVVPASADPTDTQKMIRYEIKQIKMFKGFEKVKDVQYIYTPFDSSLCGVKLEANSQKQYLLTGQILSDGKVFIHLCNYIEPWENLSFLQRESLNHHYHLNCGCQCSLTPRIGTTGGCTTECQICANPGKSCNQQYGGMAGVPGRHSPKVFLSLRTVYCKKSLRATLLASLQTPAP